MSASPDMCINQNRSSEFHECAVIQQVCSVSLWVSAAYCLCRATIQAYFPGCSLIAQMWKSSSLQVCNQCCIQLFQWPITSDFRLCIHQHHLNDGPIAGDSELYNFPRTKTCMMAFDTSKWISMPARGNSFSSAVPGQATRHAKFQFVR